MQSLEKIVAPCWLHMPRQSRKVRGRFCAADGGCVGRVLKDLVVHGTVGGRDSPLPVSSSARARAIVFSRDTTEQAGTSEFTRRAECWMGYNMWFDLGGAYPAEQADSKKLRTVLTCWMGHDLSCGLGGAGPTGCGTGARRAKTCWQLL